MSQLSLFGSEGDGEVDLAPLGADVAESAGRLSPALRFGTTSWAYSGWIGSFYGKAFRDKELVKKGLAAYAKHPLLRTVELDRSYYEPPSVDSYAELAAQVPDGFRFVAKAHQDCTIVRFPDHSRSGARAGQRNPHLLDASYAAECVVAPFVEGLGAKAGPLVFQFSRLEIRSPERFAATLHDFLRRLPPGPIYAVELRNPELLIPAYGAALADTGAVHCHNAWGFMPGVLQQRAALPDAARRVLVARWLARPCDTHEAARLRYQPFSQLVDEDSDRRQAFADLAAVAIASGSEAFLVVDNKAEGHAPESVRRLAAQIARQPAAPR